MAITQRENETDRRGDSDEEAWFVFCQTCGFHPADADDAVVGHTEQSKAQNVADMHNGVGHRTFVVSSTLLDMDGRTRTRRVHGR